MSDADRDLMVVRLAAARGAMVMGYRRAIEGKVLRCACGYQEEPRVEMFGEGWPECHGTTMSLVAASSSTPGGDE